MSASPIPHPKPVAMPPPAPKKPRRTQRVEETSTTTPLRTARRNLTPVLREAAEKGRAQPIQMLERSTALLNPVVTDLDFVQCKQLVYVTNSIEINSFSVADWRLDRLFCQLYLLSDEKGIPIPCWAVKTSGGIRYIPHSLMGPIWSYLAEKQ